MNILNEKFTSAAKKTIKKAITFAQKNSDLELNNIHLLYGLLKQKGSLASELLTKYKCSEKKLLKLATPKIKIINKTKKIPLAEIEISEEFKKTLIQTALLAYINNHLYISTEHLLSSLIKIAPDLITKIIEPKSSFKELQKELLSILRGNSHFEDITKEPSRTTEENQSDPNASVLHSFAYNLTNNSNQKKLTPVISREKEIDQLIEIISRKTKNNPLLIGDPGVGKTAIIEGLAKKIYNREAPDILLNKKIYSLDLSLLVAGTMYRGEFEGRIKQLIEEVKNNSDIILFIDEVHQLIGTGSTSGSMDAANILKPALARGQIRCIGATTYEEYHKYIAKDPALERRFQTINIKEPTPKNTLDILQGIKTTYEEYHNAVIPTGILELTVKLVDKYIPNKFFPDKAIDVIDQACAKSRIRQQKNKLFKHIKETEEQLIKTLEQKRQTVLEEKFEESLKLKSKEKGLRDLLIEHYKKLDLKENRGLVTEEDVAKVISSMNDVDYKTILESENSKLLKIEKKLNSSIFGQENATQQICNSIKRNYTGLGDAKKPLGSFLFIGPSGVGKTSIAKLLAKHLFNDENNIIQLDMSEYSEKFTTSKLLGAPAGYIGHEDSGILTHQLRKKPHSVILFDEIEKAHPDIYNLLLQILDEGCATDAQGKKIFFKNNIIILTSNAVSSVFNDSLLGFDNKNITDKTKEAKKGLDSYFRPELLNRIEDIVVFNKLGMNNFKKIIQLKVKEINTKIKNKNTKIKVTKDCEDFIISLCLDKGVRELEKHIKEYIINPVSTYLLENPNLKDKTITITIKNNKSVITS